MPHEVAGEIYYIKQKVDYLEAITASLGFQCCEQSNFYSIIDSKGEVAYTAEEKSGCLCRCCCAPNHKFQLDIHEGKEVKSEPVMTMYHPFKFPPCCPICCDIQRGEIIVYDGKVNAYDDDEKGEVISHVKQPVGGGGFHPSFQVWEGEANDDKDPTYTVEGPCCCIGGICGECFFPPTFNVKAGKGGEEEEVLSEIKKDKPEGLGGAAKTMLTDADNFTIHMPNGASTQTRVDVGNHLSRPPQCLDVPFKCALRLQSWLPLCSWIMLSSRKMEIVTWLTARRKQDLFAGAAISTATGASALAT